MHQWIWKFNFLESLLSATADTLLTPSNLSFWQPMVFLVLYISVPVLRRRLPLILLLRWSVYVVCPPPVLSTISWLEHNIRLCADIYLIWRLARRKSCLQVPGFQKKGKAFFFSLRSCLGSLCQILDLTHVRQLNYASTTSSSTLDHILDFQFELRRSVSHSEPGLNLGSTTAAQTLNQWNALPSSLKAASSNSGSRATALVRFEVQARVIRGRAVIASTVQDIKIFDSQRPTPPTCIADFAPEYVCEQAKALKKNVFKSLGTVFIVLDEPAPFEFQTSLEQATTKLPVSVHVQNSSGLGENLMPFGLVADITWRLKASTFVMMKETAGLPTVQQASTSQFVTECTVFGQRRRLKLRWPQWEEVPLCTNVKIDKAWKTKEDLWLSIPVSCHIPPTFSAPYLVRRYSISLRMSFRGTGRAEARFNVPVQVIYRTSPQPENTFTSVQSDITALSQGSSESLQLDLPRYIPWLSEAGDAWCALTAKQRLVKNLFSQLT